ncbi:MAG: SOS response-associated peptidase [Planctomycetota bacterium]|nr:SOS response-associated peptidase [Planctomycetota bacterium]
MCGRFTHLYRWKDIHRLLNLLGGADVVIPNRFNVAPTQLAPIVRERAAREGHPAGRVLEFFRWGLVPSWAKDESGGGRAINARSESAATSPAFRGAFVKRRCLVPVSGFYEWQAVRAPGVDGAAEGGPDGAGHAITRGRARGARGDQTLSLFGAEAPEPPTGAGGAERAEGLGRSGGARKKPARPIKQPWYITPTSPDPFMLAGLWEFWRGTKDGEAPALLTFTVLTTAPNAVMMPLHDRMPVILPASAWDAWLDSALEDAATLQKLLGPCDPALMRATPVSTWVNAPAHDDSRCIEAVTRPYAGA